MYLKPVLLIHKRLESFHPATNPPRQDAGILKLLGYFYEIVLFFLCCCLCTQTNEITAFTDGCPIDNARQTNP
jgi:hypothetical protein